MSVTERAARPPAPLADERLMRTSLLRRILVRPEMGSVAGAIVLWIAFAIVAGNHGFLTWLGTASYLQVAAELGILCVPVALLMIGGEFDLSVGSTIGACSMLIVLLSVQYHWNIWGAMAVSLLMALLIGLLNAALVLRTGLPSFIVTLATLFIIRGATIGMTRHVTGRTQVGGLDSADGYKTAEKVFSSALTINHGAFPISILWWLVIAGIATWILLRTSFGNWIFGAGGGLDAARNVGVPVSLVKVVLFMLTGVGAWLVGVIQAVEFTGSDVLRGENQEFYAIIAVVIGGTLLTGGYGSAIGAVFGAFIIGMVEQGIIFARIDADWFQVFLGAMLLIAVLINTYVRRRAMERR